MPYAPGLLAWTSSLRSRSGGLPLDELLATSDVVSLHCPLTPQTHHLIGAGALAAMKQTAFLVNTARGPVVDEAALADALEHGTIAGSQPSMSSSTSLR